MVYSVATFVVTFLVLRFGYNAEYFPYFHTMPHEEFKTTMLYCAIAVSVELINVIVIQKVYYRSKVHIVQRTVNVLANSRFRCFVIAACSVCTLNVIVARIHVCETCFSTQ